MQREIEDRKGRHENDQHPNHSASGAQHIAARLVLLAKLVRLALALRPPRGRDHHFVRVHRHLALGDGHRAFLVLAARPDQMVIADTEATSASGGTAGTAAISEGAADAAVCDVQTASAGASDAVHIAVRCRGGCGHGSVQRHISLEAKRALPQRYRDPTVQTLRSGWHGTDR